MLATLAEKGATLPLPIDVVVAKEFSATAPATTRRADDVQPDEMILDIGPQSALALAQMIRSAAPSSGTDPSVCSSSTPSAKGRGRWRLQSPKPLPMARFRSPEAAIRSRRSPSTISAIASATSRPEVARFSSILKARVLPAIEVLEQRAANKDFSPSAGPGD